jgi:dolichol-phosphate mannosyltransferase
MLRRSTFEAGKEFNPVGYKIGLELIVKCRCERVVEVPIHFEDRRFGESKLTFKQQLLYLQHLRRLYVFKYGVWTELLQFLVVGAVGTVVNEVALTALLNLGLTVRPALAVAIFVSMCSNFVLNRRFSFAHARKAPWLRQFGTFIAASSVGAFINYLVADLALREVPGLRPQIAALFGIAVGTAFNFGASRYLVFRKSHVRTGRAPE